MSRETKLTPLYLKTLSQKFDLETIFILNAKERNIQGGIDSLKDCSNLLNCDLSLNRITMISGIDQLQNLKILNISYNRLTNIEIIKGCRALEKVFA